MYCLLVYSLPVLHHDLWPLCTMWPWPVQSAHPMLVMLVLYWKCPNLCRYLPVWFCTSPAWTLHCLLMYIFCFIWRLLCPLKFVFCCYILCCLLSWDFVHQNSVKKLLPWNASDAFLSAQICILFCCNLCLLFSEIMYKICFLETPSLYILAFS